MRLALFSLLICLLSAPLLAQNAPTPDAAATTHEKSVATSEAQHRDRVFAFKKTYTAELERHESVAKAKGDLDGVLAIREERERMDRPLTAAEMKALPEPARASRAKFDQSVAKSAAQERAEIQAHDRVYVAALQALQARLTRAGDIEGAVKAKNALQALLSGKKNAAPIVAPPPIREPLTPPPSSVSSTPIAVASEIKAKGSVKDPGPNVLPFSAPKGNGRSGAIGLLIKNPPAVGRNGSEWAFTYKRGGSAYGLQIIHPYGRGQFIVHLNKEDVAASTPEKWIQVGFGAGDAKRIKMARISGSIFPLEDDKEYAVVSRVSPSGGFELTINGQPVAAGRATGAEPLSLEIPEGSRFSGSGRGELEFKGADLPLKWEAGFAGIIVGPHDSGVHVCRDVRFTPSAPAN